MPQGSSKEQISHKRTTTVLAPDKGSGIAFTTSLIESVGHKHNVTTMNIEVSPRVIEGQLTQNVEEVTRQLQQAILEAVDAGATDITIACNTLSLTVFAQHARERATDILRRKGREVPHFFLTITEIKKYIDENRNKNIILLGTKPLSTILSSEIEGKTLTEENDLDLVQEIIWRVKAADNSDVSTAPSYDVPLSNKNENATELLKKVQQLNMLLMKLNIEEVIMACTELPTAFALLKQATNEKLAYKLIDPAELVAQAMREY